MKKIEKIMNKVNIEKIQMKNMESFKNNLKDQINICESIETIEIKKLYNDLLEIGNELANAYDEAKLKYLKMMSDKEKNYIDCMVIYYKKSNQNNEIKKYVINKKKSIVMNTKNKSERVKLFHELENKNKHIAQFNKSSMKILEDSAQAEILATFHIFKDLSNSVDEVYGNSENNKVIVSNLLKIISTLASNAAPALGFLLDSHDILQSVLNLINSANRDTSTNNNALSADKGIKQLRNKFTNRMVALLAVKIYLEDMDYLHQFFDDEKNCN